MKLFFLLLLMAPSLYGKTYLNFHNYVYSYEVGVSKGEPLADVLLRYGYNLEERDWVQITRLMNGFRENVAEQSTLYLPIVDSIPLSQEERSVDEVVIEETTEGKESSRKFGLGLVIGTVDIKRGSNKFSADFLKPIGSFSIRYLEDRSLTVSLGLTHFRNLKHSSSKETENSSTVYPEFGVEGRKFFKKISIGVSLDALYYFLASDKNSSVEIKPSMISRLSIRPSYTLTKDVSALGAFGYLKSFDSKNINGFDLSMGLSYIIDQNQQWSLTGIYNTNILNTSEASSHDKSQAWVLALIRLF